MRGEPIPWRTPSGNLLNPLFFGPQLALHAIFPPSFALLRATAVVSGMLALDRQLLALRPRFRPKNCDHFDHYSGGAADRRRLQPACLGRESVAAGDAAVRLSAGLGDYRSSAESSLQHRGSRGIGDCDRRSSDEFVCCSDRNCLLGLCVARTCCCEPADQLPTDMSCVAGSRRPRESPLQLQWQLRVAMSPRPAWFGPAFARVANPAQYAEFTANLGRLFTGATVYEYVAGALNPSNAPTTGGGFRWDCLPYDAAAWIVAGWLIWGLFRLFGQNRPELVCLAHRMDCEFARLLFRCRPRRGGSEFRALRDLDRRTDGGSGVDRDRVRGTHGRPVWDDGSRLVSIALGWMLLFGFQTNCLDFIRQTGGQSHRTFRTAEVEPKQAALAAILARARTTRKCSNRHERMVDLLADAVSQFEPSIGQHRCAHSSRNAIGGATAPRRFRFNANVAR